jgi:predicted secreted hydrolase
MKFLMLLLTLPVFAEVTPPFTRDGFRVPQPGQALTFPRNHGSHPDFRLEWWYITGHLTDDQGEAHGFQLTFFRSALRPFPEQQDDGQAFGRDQLHMAHSAWLEVDADRFHSEERLARGGWDAGASEQGLNLFQGNWRLAARDGDPNPKMDAFFTVDSGPRALLTFVPLKPFVRFGENGVERKGSDPTSASLYITWSRLQVGGLIEIDGQPRRVTGTAWMDHEISSSQLEEGQVGWDWASIHLDDGREIMMYILRREDGSKDPYSVLYWIDRDGGLTLVRPADFRWRATRTWTSPDSGGVYPLDWLLAVRDPESGEMVRLQIRPLRDAQEHAGRLSGIPYWEGACEVLIRGRPAGRAYVELTGYASPLEAVRGNSAFRRSEK